MGITKQFQPHARLTSTLEAGVYTAGAWLVTIVTAILVVMAGVDLENVALLVLIIVSFILARNTGIEIPFLIMAVHLLVSTVYAAIFLKASAISLPEHYAALIGKPQVLWLAVYPLCAALGIRLAVNKMRPTTGSGLQLGAPQIPLVALLPLWLLTTLIATIYPDYDNPAIRILVHHVIPLLSAALAIRVRHPLAVFAIVALSLLPPILTTYRHIVGQYLLLYALIYLVMMRDSVKMRRAAIPLLIGGALIGGTMFYLMTFLKYGEYPEGHVFTRVLLIQAHSALRIKSSVDSGTAFSDEEKAGIDRYWLGLVPFVEKPINSGHFTYEMSRDAGTRNSDIPYLPPAAPAELYMTGGWAHLIVGSLIHGMLIAFAWNWAARLSSSPIQLAGLVMAVVVLCGIGGGIDLYGRLEAAKWSVFILIGLWLLASVFEKGRLLTFRAPRMAAV